MHATLRHLSLVVQSPSRCARILAEMSAGTAQPFRARFLPDAAAWICLWNAETNELVEFLPPGTTLTPHEDGMVFSVSNPVETLSQGCHIQVETSVARAQIEAIAQRESCPFLLRTRYGGPLLEVWLEPQFLVEFTSDEIRNCNDQPARIKTTV